jgi:hypothetical protein
MILQSDGKILVTWTIDSSARIVRFNTDWSRDYSLTENEVHTFAYWFEMDADFDWNWNTLVVWDFWRYNWQTATWIVRIRSNWQLDGTFNTWTWFQWWSAAGIRVEDDGNILVFGSFNNLNYRGNTLSWCIVRLDSGWNLIDNFTNNELWISYCWTSFWTYNPLQIQDDGKIIIAWLGGWIDGQNDLIRVTKSWTIDTIFDTSWYTSFNIKSYQITPDYWVTIFWDFEMIVNGNTITHHILRFLPNWLRDYTINIAAFKNNTSEWSVEWGIVDGSGNIVVSGYFTTYGWNPTPKWIVSINGSWVYNSNFSYTTSAPTQWITIRNLSLFSDNTINFTERSDIPFFSLSVKRITETWNIDSSLQTGTGIYWLARRK